mmetsp:Transcript_2733/g.6182  ORF Transcript_2733/g.6182 Transcript_2733/m.6182 type:complete len:237 (-) Transcript_2733:53-763(-)
MFRPSAPLTSRCGPPRASVAVERHLGPLQRSRSGVWMSLLSPGQGPRLGWRSRGVWLPRQRVGRKAVSWVGSPGLSLYSRPRSRITGLPPRLGARPSPTATPSNGAPSRPRGRPTPLTWTPPRPPPLPAPPPAPGPAGRSPSRPGDPRSAGRPPALGGSGSPAGTGTRRSRWGPPHRTPLGCCRRGRGGLPRRGTAPGRLHRRWWVGWHGGLSTSRWLWVICRMLRPLCVFQPSPG